MCRGLTTLHTVPYNGIEKGDDKRKRREILTANNSNTVSFKKCFTIFFLHIKAVFYAARSRVLFSLNTNQTETHHKV